MEKLLKLEAIVQEFKNNLIEEKEKFKDSLEYIVMQEIEHEIEIYDIVLKQIIKLKQCDTVEKN